MKNTGKKVLILSFLFLIIIILLYLYFYLGYTITLNGDEEMILYSGFEYNEPGYSAYTRKGSNVTELVSIDNNLDVNVPGDYEIIYKIKGVKKKRIVHVQKSSISNINFYLVGDEVIDINLDDEFNDPGFVAKYLLDKVSFDDYVNVVGEVDTTKVGSYEINYLLMIDGMRKTLTRTVNVIGDKYTVILSNEEMTNENVKAIFKNNMKNFLYFMDPNKNLIYNEVFSYDFSENGNYEFNLYTENDIVKIDLEINNIDKEPPKGSCIANINGGITSFFVDATDNNKIDKYIYNNNSYLEKTFSVNGKIENGNVTIYDEVGNNTIVSCIPIYAYIGPGNKSVNRKYESDTLKYWIEKDGLYITHIWVNDAYNQIRTAVATPFPSLAYVSSIISSTGNKDKELVAVNASFFTSSNFDLSYWRKIPEWRNSSISPIVIVDGKVLRDFTNRQLVSAINNMYVVGFKNDYTFGLYKFKENDISSNSKTSAKMISDGVKYTFSISGRLVNNYKSVSNGSDSAGRTGLCQIDRNNYVIFTGNTSLESLSKKMVSLGCKEGINLDGGGSTTLLYKSKGSNSSKVLFGNGRRVADSLYFVE